MKIPLVIVTHGEWGKEMVLTAESIAGKQENIYIASVSYEESPESFDTFLAKLVDEIVSLEKTLFLVDIKGGTPWNAVLKLKRNGNITCVAGINLPMLLEVIIAREKGGAIRDLAKTAVNTGKQGITIIEAG